MSVPEPISDGIYKWGKNKREKQFRLFIQQVLWNVNTHLCPRSHVTVRNYIYIYSDIPTTHANESEVIWEVVEAEKDSFFQQHDVAFGLTWFHIHYGGLLWHGGIGNRAIGLFFWRWSWWVISTVWTVTYWTEPGNEKKTKNKKNHNIIQLQAAALTGV